ncbi:MAG: MsnO8 family LLM class oxidoreductase [Finegoldia sp.]|nr:MsnO8 family LLM class oxidoreductase [Finegoldia sp.]
MELSVHDLVTQNENVSNSELFEDTKKLVKATDKMGYKRYWFSEHHGVSQVFSTSPEILVAYFSSLTENIRLGTGGTMIMHYSPLEIAEKFKELSYMAPGRIDIGLGRAPGGGVEEIFALSQGSYNIDQDLYEKIEVILAYLQDKTPYNKLYASTKAYPEKNDYLIEPWLLGSSGSSSKKAGEMGLGYSFAKFFSVDTPNFVFDTYRDSFRPSNFFDKAQLSVSYKILVTDTKEELEYLGKAFDYGQVKWGKKGMKYLPNPESVKDYKFTPFEEDKLRNDYGKRFIIKGTKGQVADILENEIKTIGMDEILVYTPIWGVENRIKSYKLLKEIFD